jgi:hypothetical protein
MSALLEGRLVADSHAGLALSQADGVVRAVIWPAGYSVVRNGSLALINDRGETVARVGDAVELAGGERGPTGAWQVCPDQIVVTAGAPP